MTRVISAVLLTTALLAVSVSPAQAFFGGNETTNNYDTTYNKGGSAHAKGGDAKSKSESSSKAKASARSSAASKSGAAAGAVSGSGGNSMSTKLNFEGDEVGAAGGAVVLDVQYQCGGTAAGYLHFPGGAVGGGAATAFELCEDVFIAEKAIQYGIEGAGDFLKAILVRRVGDFNARRADAPVQNNSRD